MNADLLLFVRRSYRRLFWAGVLNYLAALANTIGYNRSGSWISLVCLAVNLYWMTRAWRMWEIDREWCRMMAPCVKEMRALRIQMARTARENGLPQLPRYRCPRPKPKKCS